MHTVLDSGRVPKIRRWSMLMSMMGQMDMPLRPSRIYRLAMNPTKSPYNFVKVKRRRKIAAASRKRNRRH